MVDVLDLLNGVPGGWFLALFFALVFGPPAILSKTAAEKFGAFGAIARWWRDRPLMRIEQQEKQTFAEVEVLVRRVKTLEDHIKVLAAEQRRERREYLEAAAEDRKQWREALDSAEEEIESVRAGIRIRDRSVFALYDWSIRARVEALNGGVTLPPIPEITFLAVDEKRNLSLSDERPPPEDSDTIDP